MAKVQMRDMARTLKDLNREPANIPTGVWDVIRFISLKQKDVTKKTRDGEEYETVEYTLVGEPVTPSKSVNPDELNELDERTGKPVYEGKRLFLRFVESFRSDMKDLVTALGVMGFGEDDDFDKIVEGNLVKGRSAKGEIFNRTYPKNDGTQGTEQKIRGWAKAGSSAGFAI